MVGLDRNNKQSIFIILRTQEDANGPKLDTTCTDQIMTPWKLTRLLILPNNPNLSLSLNFILIICTQYQGNPCMLTPQPPASSLSLPDRLRIIDTVLVQLNIPRTLPVALTLDSIRSQAPRPHQPQVFYQVPGHRHRLRTQVANLLEKLDREDERVQRSDGRDKGSSSDERGEAALEDEPSYNPEDQFRYYRDNVLCFKCNKIGHYKGSCPQVPICMYCLSPDHAAQPQKCPQKNVCFRCYSFGHVISQCRSKQSHSRCPYCEKHHQGKCQFLLPKIRDSARRREFFTAIHEDKDIRCIRCMGYGHIECGRGREPL